MSITIKWKINTSEGILVRQVLERKPVGSSPVHVQGNALEKLWGYTKRVGYALVRPLPGTGWRMVADNIPPGATEYTDNEEFNGRALARPTYWHNRKILDNQSYAYRIRGITSTGKATRWSKNFVVGALGMTENGIQVPEHIPPELEEKFRKAMENPGKIRLWFKNSDDKNLKGAEAIIYPLGYEKYIRLGPYVSNRDGIIPADQVLATTALTPPTTEEGSEEVSGPAHAAIPADAHGYLLVPSGMVIIIEYIYKLGSDEKYLSNKKEYLFFKKTEFKQAHRLPPLSPGETRPEIITLPIGSEYPQGFEPMIIGIDIESQPGKILVKGRIDSTTGRD